MKGYKYNKKPIYVSEKEIFDIECAIYNDDNKALFKSLPKGVEDDNKTNIIEDLAKSQRYYVIPSTNIMLREDGRLFNLKFIRPLKPLWTPHDIIINANGKQIRYSTIYEQEAWEFDHLQIVTRYIVNNWGISVTHGYHETFDERYKLIANQ